MEKYFFFMSALTLIAATTILTSCHSLRGGEGEDDQMFDIFLSIDHAVVRTISEAYDSTGDCSGDRPCNTAPLTGNTLRFTHAADSFFVNALPGATLELDITALKTAEYSDADADNSFLGADEFVINGTGTLALPDDRLFAFDIQDMEWCLARYNILGEIYRESTYRHCRLTLSLDAGGRRTVYHYTGNGSCIKCNETGRWILSYLD